MTKAAFTVHTAAEELAVSPNWLYSRAQRREIPHQRYGRAVRFTAEQLEEIRLIHSQPVVGVTDLATSRSRRRRAA